MSRSIVLSSGLSASFEQATVDDGLVLVVGGAEQSHVYPDAPQRIFYEYLRRVANILDIVLEGRAEPEVLHLGAGALTLPRYLAATRPGSRQVVVELERELFGFVDRHVPIPPGIQCVVEDAGQYVSGLHAHRFDAIVLDIFTGRDSPEHLADPAYYADLRRVCTLGGVVVVNLGDDAGMAFAGRQLRHLEGVFGDVLATGEASLFSGRYPGNVIAAASPRRLLEDVVERLDALGPYPVKTLRGADLDRFGEP